MAHAFDNPGLLQRAIRKLISLAPVSAVLANTAHHLDEPVLRRSNGRYSVSSLMTGLPIVRLTATGAKSGELRTVPLVVIPDDNRLLLIASNWGRSRHPSWYYNVRANPQVQVSASGHTSDWIARELAGSEREAAWQKALAVYPGYGYYAERNGGLPIPVVALES